MSTATLKEVEQSMRCTPTQEGFVRLLGISFLYKGCSKEEVGRLMNLSLRTLQRWIKDFNEGGIDAVIGSRRTGRRRNIGAADFALKYKEEFLSSSQTAICFHGLLVKEYKEELCYSTLLNYLQEQGLSRVLGRPVCKQRDEEKRVLFIKEFQAIVKSGTEIWFADEVGFDGDPKPRKRWVQKG
jgi:transposase